MAAYKHAIYAFLLTVPLLWQCSTGMSIDYSWDYMVFTQTWPIPFCLTWKQKSSKHWCTMPKDPDQWTIHGVWPNKYGQRGPNNCNSSWPFDMSQIEPFQADLEQRWPNLEGGTKLQWLWQHEWTKHGTCAAQLNAMNSVGKYFKKGLDLNAQYNMTRILGTGGVLPNDCTNYSAKQIVSAIKATIGTDLQVTCAKDKQGVHYLQEVRICVDKSFQPIDCTKTMMDALDAPGVNAGTCPNGQVINYPKTMSGFYSQCTGPNM